MRRVEPEYPVDLRRDRVEGDVILGATIDVDGSLRDLCVLSVADPRLGDLAVAAVRQWVFKPGTVDGAPVPTTRARGYNDLAWVYRKLGDTERAEELARKSVSLRRDHSSSLFFFLVDRGDFAAANTLLKSIEESQSSRGTRLTLRFVYFLHGYEALKSGQRDTAIELFRL